MFIFDEEVGVMLERTRAMGFDLAGLRDRGQLTIEQVDAAELSPGEFAHLVRSQVDEAQAKTVVIDSLNGYQAAMPEEGASSCTCTSFCSTSTARGPRPS